MKTKKSYYSWYNLINPLKPFVIRFDFQENGWAGYLSSHVTSKFIFLFRFTSYIPRKGKKESLDFEGIGQKKKQHYKTRCMCAYLISSPLKGWIIPRWKHKSTKKEPDVYQIDLVKMGIIHISSHKKWRDLIIIRKQEHKNNMSQPESIQHQDNYAAF